MESLIHNNREYKGVLTGLKVRMHKNRLGELLVLDGFISAQELQQALIVSKTSGKPLGRVLADEKVVEYDIIRQTLIEQFMLRFMMAILTVFISFAGIATGGAKTARAAPTPSGAPERCSSTRCVTPTPTTRSPTT